MALYRLHRHPPFDRPVLVIAMEGWVDAGLGAAAATAHLLGAVKGDVVATFDADELLDHRARRPVAHLVDGINTGLTWPTTEVQAGRDRAGHDVALLVGPEPDMRWHAFIDAVVELATGLGVRLAVGLGAFPAAAPHTRPVRLAASATDPDLAARVGVIAGSLDVPAGIESALEVSLGQAGIPAVGLWARVPHYVAAMPYPAASAALVDGLAAVADLVLDSATLHRAADLARQRVDELIAESEEHREMVRQLESRIDTAEGNPLDLGQVPSGDEIAAELERYLRGEQGEH
ncbi:MAG: proteasome assembly chaperone family protein [Acidimicrobiales bacterium]